MSLKITRDAVLYFGALSAILASLYFGTSYGGAALVSRLYDTDQKPTTRLDEMIANAREIRQALAKPIPQPERLGPITQRLASSKVPGSKVQDIVEPKVAAKPRLSREARDAYALGRDNHVSYTPFDRHRVD